MNKSVNLLLTLAVLCLSLAAVKADYRDRGYLYLFPSPGAEFTSRSTKYILVRLKGVPPRAITNLASFISVTGTTSGPHSGKAKIATDQRTIIFELDKTFQSSEVVTVALDPRPATGPPGIIAPFRYKFATSGPMPDPPTLSARGEAPPGNTADKAFDEDPATTWRDLAVPDGATQSSWLQLLYPGSETRVIDQYVVTCSAVPAAAPADWQLYGLDSSTNLILLDTQKGRVFPAPLASITCTITNVLGYRGYRLLITKVKDPAKAASLQIAELAFLEHQGAILREYWNGIPGKWISDLTSNPRFPASPNGSELLPSFEAPSDWADNYGARLRGFVTAPASGNFVFWISGDEACELWLGTNVFADTKRRIATGVDWTEPRQWIKYPGQRSELIPLIAGQKYYIEALQKEAQGADNLVVAWSKPGESIVLPSEIIPGSVLSPWETVIRGPDSQLRPLSSRLESPKLLSLGPARDPAPRAKSSAKLLPNGVSIPSDFPQLEITLNNNPSPGYIFLENAGQAGSRYTLMLDNSGAPVWYRRGEGRDFKIQGDGTISWGAAFTGQYTPFTGMDANFVFQRTYSAVNGFGTDEHELKVLPNGGYLLLGARGEMTDLRRYVPGGFYNAFAYQTVLQEFTAAGELVFQFCAWDHFKIQDLDPVIEDPRNVSVRFPHINAIDVDDDGHLLISSRHLNEVSKINRDTGEILWRLGGAHSDFAFEGDNLNGFKGQHDITALGKNRYLLFDNGNGHSPPMSRAAEYWLDLPNKKARLTWEFRDNPSKFTHFMGSAQRLPNGNTLINFALGEYPKVTEVDRAGVKRLVMNLAPQSDLYRAFRFPWHGTVPVPYLLVEPQADKVTLIFNKFGDATVDYYRIYGGTSPEPTDLIATSRTTLKHLTNVVNGAYNYFRVTAVSTAGVESDYSNEENVLVNIVLPGENMVMNPSFSEGTNDWGLMLAGGATATWNTKNGLAGLVIANGGAQLSAVQLRQAGINLIQGKMYDLEFDAWADQPRYLEVRLSSLASPPVSYSNFQPFYLIPVRTHYHVSFTMSAPSDANVLLLVNAGASVADVYLDNISLSFHDPIPGDLNRDGLVNLLDLKLLAKDWLRKGDSASDLNQDGQVDFQDLNALGTNWRR